MKRNLQKELERRKIIYTLNGYGSAIEVKMNYIKCDKYNLKYKEYTYCYIILNPLEYLVTKGKKIKICLYSGIERICKSTYII